jgi:glycerate kinase
MPRILIVPDKFKGSLTAHAAALAIAAGWRRGRPGDQLEKLPMSDGGDGFGWVLGGLMGARRKYMRAVDAAHRSLRSCWWHDDGGKTAIIDSAQIIGVAMLPKKKFHPFQLDSFGLGVVMRSAPKSGATGLIIGLGGSATNDAGFGMARALGWKFFNKYREELEEWWRLHELTDARPPACSFPCNVTVAVDVGNPLLGPKGCSRIYGPQKGLRPQDFAVAEKCLARLAAVLKEQHGIEGAKIAGAGAAGGLGFGLMAFAGARIKSGFEMFARYARLDDRISHSDLVITGEGRMDNQTYMGKGVGQIARRCVKLGVPCLALVGTVVEPARARRLFAQTRALTEITNPRRAQSQPALHLQKLACQAAKAFLGSTGR